MQGLASEVFGSAHADIFDKADAIATDVGQNYNPGWLTWDAWFGNARNARMERVEDLFNDGRLNDYAQLYVIGASLEFASVIAGFEDTIDKSALFATDSAARDAVMAAVWQELANGYAEHGTSYAYVLAGELGLDLLVDTGAAIVDVAEGTLLSFYNVTDPMDLGLEQAEALSALPEVLSTVALAGIGAKVARKGLAKTFDITAPTKCFVAGTPILTTEGYKNIEDIRVGDMVISRDDMNMMTVVKPVTQLFQNKNKQIVSVTLEDESGTSETLGTTEEHPFYVDGKGWVEAADLTASDLVVSHASGEGLGGFLRVKAVVLEDARQDTYNFEVADTHTYFVGQLNAWVHNACDPGDLLANGGGRLDDTTIIGVYGNKFTELPDGTYENIGPATADEIAAAKVVVEVQSFAYGTSGGGPGRWLKEKLGNKEAAEYQAFVTGKPVGTQYVVDNPNTLSGTTSFDDFDLETNTLVDAKLFKRWPNPDFEFSASSIIKQASKQIEYAENVGASVKWFLPDQDAVDRVRKIFDAETSYRGTSNFSAIHLEVAPPQVN